MHYDVLRFKKLVVAEADAACFGFLWQRSSAFQQYVDAPPQFAFRHLRSDDVDELAVGGFGAEGRPSRCLNNKKDGQVQRFADGVHVAPRGLSSAKARQDKMETLPTDKGAHQFEDVAEVLRRMTQRFDLLSELAALDFQIIHDGHGCRLCEGNSFSWILGGDDDAQARCACGERGAGCATRIPGSRRNAQKQTRVRQLCRNPARGKSISCPMILRRRRIRLMPFFSTLHGDPGTAFASVQ
jgi:hypothetical protein